VLTGGDGNDELDGGNGNDIMTGGGGDDRVVGGNGNNTFVFGAGFGHDTVADFGSGDHIQFVDGVFQNFQSVLAASQQVGGDTVITRDAGDSIVLQGVTLGSLSANNFSFT
jgi:Ca2+-binding RTX toxin-like protein